MKFGISELDKVIAPAGNGIWVQIHDFTPGELDEKLKRGRMVALLQVKIDENEETIKLVETGREVLAFLHEQYFGSLENGCLESLKVSLEKVKAEFNFGIEIVVVIDTDEIIYVATCGGSRIYAYLEGKSGFVGKEENKTVRVFSFLKKLNTQMVLGTSQFWARIGEGRIRALLESGKTGYEIAEELGIVIGGDGFGSGIGGIILKLGEIQSNEITEIASIEEIEGKTDLLTPNNWKTGVSNFWMNSGEKFHSRFEKNKFVKSINWGWVVFGCMATLVLLGGFMRQYRSKNNKEIQTKVIEVEQRLKEADILVDNNPDRAKQIMSEVQPILDELVSQKIDKSGDLQNMANRISEAATGLMRIELKEVFDLNLLRDGMEISEIVRDGDKILLLDKPGGRIVDFNTSTDTGEVVLGGEELAGLSVIAKYSNQLFIGGNFGVKICNMSTWKCEKKLGRSELPDELTDMQIWAGNIYILDGKDGSIWKIAKQDSGYVKKTLWKSSETDLVGALNIQIDGRIWASYQNGGLGRYNLGQNERFSISGVSPNIGQKARLQTSDEMTKLYIHDAENKRLVVLDKGGVFLKQWVSDNLGKVGGFVVFEEAAKLYVSVGSKIYKATLP